MDEQQRPDEWDGTHLARLARTLEPKDIEHLAVPDDLWSKIEAELAGDGATVADGSGVQPGAGGAATPQSGGRVVELRPARGSRVVWFSGVLAVAASLVLATWIVARSGDDGRVLAAAALSNEGLARFPVVPHGSARLVDDHGRMYLDVHVEDAPAVQGDYVELWLIDRQVKGMVSLGPYHGDDRYEVPAGIDPVQFPIVDVSLEPSDGVPTHSGTSILRGALESAPSA